MNKVVEALKSAVVTAITNEFHTVIFPIAQARELVSEAEAMAEVCEAIKCMLDSDGHLSYTQIELRALIKALDKYQHLQDKP